MTNKANDQIPNDWSIGNWDLVIDWSLGLGHLLVIGPWSFCPGVSSSRAGPVYSRSSVPLVTPSCSITRSERIVAFGSAWPDNTSAYRASSGATSCALLSQHLNAEMPYPQLPHPRHVLRRRLRLGVVDGVATADIGDQRMRLADAVFQIDLMPVARPAAVAIVFAVATACGRRRNAPCGTSACAGG